MAGHRTVRALPLDVGLWVGSEKETGMVCLFMQIDDFLIIYSKTLKLCSYSFSHSWEERESL